MKFTGQELISDVLSSIPDAHEILLTHGLSCVGCHINVYETLEQGCLGHGFSQDLYQNVLKDLNEAAAEIDLKSKQPPKPPFLTKFAVQKIVEFQKLQKKEGWGLRIEVFEKDGKDDYFLDFEEKPDKSDRIVTTRNINLFLEPDSHKRLMNCEVDFFTNDEGESGFKVEKV